LGGKESTQKISIGHFTSAQTGCRGAFTSVQSGCRSAGGAMLLLTTTLGHFGHNAMSIWWSLSQVSTFLVIIWLSSSSKLPLEHYRLSIKFNS
jgi:sugar phosphate permease